MNKNIPPLTCGLRYGYDGNGARVCLGAQMGRPNVLPDDKDAPVKLHLRRLRFVDQCYDQGGAYWGMPANMWRATTPDRSIEIFVRMVTRNGAKCKVWDILPNATFYR